ncbi:MAG TPA: DUF2269 domain-containing protein [Rhodanobacteraceae bacterium]|jgi:uncharacterized membrane protein|nr:DUF2269 domain-containing protein [Rhodanobacteraceae bacterium]
MNAYLALKTVHIVSAALLFGTGLGTAFFTWFTHRGGDVRAIATALRLAVRADFWFTTPAVVVQPVSGFAMLHVAGLDWRLPWVDAALALYLLAGACWLPVVALQIEARDLAAQALRDGAPLPAAYHRAMRWWFALGWPAFGAVLLTYWLMTAKPALWS